MNRNTYLSINQQKYLRGREYLFKIHNKEEERMEEGIETGREIQKNL